MQSPQGAAQRRSDSRPRRADRESGQFHAHSPHENISGLLADRSLDLIAQGPEGLEERDEVLVMDRGRITARGDHQHLLDGLRITYVPGSPMAKPTMGCRKTWKKHGKD